MTVTEAGEHNKEEIKGQRNGALEKSKRKYELGRRCLREAEGAVGIRYSW